MNDMRAVIIPKSDQINADDLLAGPRTITISDVTIRPGTEQPVSIHFEGDGGKPWKPCKSMARVMVHCWGPDANKYVGHSMTLYCDPQVKWGGMAVGGIRISHMTGLEVAVTMALTETKGSKKPFVVKPLVVEATPQPKATKKQTVTEWLDALEADLKGAQHAEEVDAILARDDVKKALAALKNGALERLNAAVKAAIDRAALPEPTEADPPAEDDGWPADVPVAGH